MRVRTRILLGVAICLVATSVTSSVQAQNRFGRWGRSVHRRARNFNYQAQKPQASSNSWLEQRMQQHRQHARRQTDQNRRAVQNIQRFTQRTLDRSQQAHQDRMWRNLYQQDLWQRRNQPQVQLFLPYQPYGPSSPYGQTPFWYTP